MTGARVRLEGERLIETPASLWSAWCGHVNLARTARTETAQAADHLIAAAQAHAVKRVACWSGWLGDEPFDRDPRTWMPAGLAAFERAIADIVPTLAEQGIALVVRPHARHVLCDAQRVGHFFRERDPGIGLLLDADSLIEEDMRAQAEEHRERIVEALTPIASAKLEY